MYEGTSVLYSTCMQRKDIQISVDGEDVTEAGLFG